jgi:hypothetical protein
VTCASADFSVIEGLAAPLVHAVPRKITQVTDLIEQIA